MFRTWERGRPARHALLSLLSDLGAPGFLSLVTPLPRERGCKAGRRLRSLYGNTDRQEVAFASLVHRRVTIPPSPWERGPGVRVRFSLFDYPLATAFYAVCGQFIRCLLSGFPLSSDTQTGAPYFDGAEAMLGTLEIVRKEQRRKGRQEGRQEMQREILQWIETEKENGTRFQNDPPFGMDPDHK